MKSILKSFSGIIGLASTIFGVVFLTAGLYEFKVSYQLRTTDIRVNGVVTNRYFSSSTDHAATVYIVTFKTKEGEEYIVENHFGKPDDLYNEGDTVPVLYLETEPETARFATKRGLYVTHR